MRNKFFALASLLVIASMVLAACAQQPTPGVTEVVKTVKGDVTRVRAGPFATREAAEKAREQLKSIGMNGNITTR